MEELDEAKKLWYRIAKTSAAHMPSVPIEVYKKLTTTFQPGDYYYYIFNCAAAELEFASPGIVDVIGIPPGEFKIQTLLSELIHPDDLPTFLNFENTVTRFFTELPPEKVMKYKVRYTYRIKRADGTYLQILQQVITIESDDNGGVIRTLGMHTDISHLKKDNEMNLSFIGLEGEPSFQNVKVDAIYELPEHAVCPLSKRELEVLSCLGNNLTNAQIAEALFISVRTVETHRKNMLRKSESISMSDLLMKALRQGWI